MTHDSPRAQNKASAAMGALLLALFVGTDACAAIDLASAQKAAGPWDMSLDDTNRKCRFVLRAEDGDARGAQPLAMPAVCRRALPILLDVGQWSLGPDRTLRLDDARGAPVLEFRPAGEPGTLQATGPEGETYQLVSGLEEASAPAPDPRRDPSRQIAQSSGFRVDQAPLGAGFEPRPGAGEAQSGTSRPHPEAARPQASTRQSAARPTAALAAVSPSAAAGRYAPLREGGRDTGCMITLDDKARGPRGTHRAQLAPACRDQGLVIFDPVGWQIERGHLSLMARKGHKLQFVRGADGIWTRDGEGGKPLSLKPL